MKRRINRKKMKRYIRTGCSAAAVWMAAALVLSGCNMIPDLETLPVITDGESENGASQEDSSSAEEAISSESEESTLPSEDVTQQITTEEPTETEPLPSYDIAEGYAPVWQVVEATQNVNVRRGAGTEFEAVGLLLGGEQAQRVSDGGEWSQILYDGGIYFVSTQYLKVISEGQAPESSGEQQTEPSSSEQETAPPSTERPPYTGDIAALSNETIPYGYGSNNRDEKNRPTGVLYYENLYGKYAADFMAPDTNTIYLTMDEGYEAGYTPQILDTLKEKNVKALFFLTKQFVTEHPELVQRMIDEGHVLGNHSCAHPAAGMPSLGIDGQTQDILWLHNYVKDNFGYEMKLFRYPSGIFSEQSLALLESLGYHAVFWSYAHRDWVVDDQPDEPTALQNCLNQLHPGAIYLLHAVSATNTHNMAAFIDGARAAGYEFGVYPQTGF